MAEQTKRGRGRPAGYKMPERVRERIRASVLIDRLHKVAAGEVDASPQSIQAARILLDKSLPSLQAVDHTTGGEALSVSVVQFKPK
jgi:hypothetical protein